MIDISQTSGKLEFELRGYYVNDLFGSKHVCNILVYDTVGFLMKTNLDSNVFVCSIHTIDNLDNLSYTINGFDLINELEYYL